VDWAVHGWTLFAFIAVAPKISRFAPNLIGVRQSRVPDRWNTFAQTKTGVAVYFTNLRLASATIRVEDIWARLMLKKKLTLHSVSQNCPALDTESQERTTSAYAAHITFCSVDYSSNFFIPILENQ
jgi:hypothetical protein